MQLKDAGVWFEGELFKADAFDEAVDKLLGLNRLGASSGTAAHLVERKTSSGAKGEIIPGEILHWPLGVDASLTPEPCEPRNRVYSIKNVRGNFKSLSDILREIEAGEESIEVKSVLGDLTPDVCAAAFDRLSYKLQTFVMQQLWGDSWGGCCMPSAYDTGEDPETPIDRSMIEQALQQYQETVLAVLDALLALPQADETAAKSLLAQFDVTGKSDVVTSLSALPIKSYLETMGAIVTDSHRRLTWYAEQREIKQGRAISSDNLAAMQTIRDGMKEAHSAMETHIASLDDMIERHSKEKSSVAKVPNKVASEFARYLAIGAAGAGATVKL
jgi:hypothetical protein